jgi:hypothetical protein
MGAVAFPHSVVPMQPALGKPFHREDERRGLQGSDGVGKLAEALGVVDALAADGRRGVRVR